MAIIYTYNEAIPQANDLIIGTERDATLRNPTKNFSIGQLAKFIIDTTTGTSLTLPLFFDVTDPQTGLTQTTLVDSIMTQDANPAGTAWGAVNSTTEVIPFSNVAVVTANHTGALGTFPSVTVVNNNNRVLYGEITYITVTQITVEFADPQTGSIYLN